MSLACGAERRGRGRGRRGGPRARGAGGGDPRSDRATDPGEWRRRGAHRAHVARPAAGVRAHRVGVALVVGNEGETRDLLVAFFPISSARKKVPTTLSPVVPRRRGRRRGLFSASLYYFFPQFSLPKMDFPGSVWAFVTY